MNYLHTRFWSDFTAEKTNLLDFLKQTSVTSCLRKLWESANTDLPTAHIFRSREVKGSWSWSLVNVLEASVSFLHTGQLAVHWKASGWTTKQGLDID